MYKDNIEVHIGDMVEFYNIHPIGGKMYGIIADTKAGELIRKTLKKIYRLLDDISRNGNSGIGKPEPLVGNLSGFWSRRINDTDRLVYKIDESNIYVLSCRYHYSK